jgi:hypothetical protein
MRCLGLLLLVLGVSAVSCDYADDLPPSFLTILGSKLAAAEVDSSDDDVATAADSDAKCCLPNVWQGRVRSEFGFSGRRPVLSHATDQVYVDGSQKRLAGNKLECHRGKLANYSYILLVKANKTGDLYIFDKAAKKCRYTKLSNAVWKPQCLPANATLRGTHSLGPASGGLTVQSWTFHIGSKRSAVAVADKPPRPKMSVNTNILLVPKSCIPVIVQENGVISRGKKVDQQTDDDDDDDSSSSDSNDLNDDGPKPRPQVIPFVGGMYFTDIQTRISDPSVFTPPAYCKKSDNTLDEHDDMEDLIPAVLESYLLL